jgi:hypothetical protein
MLHILLHILYISSTYPLHILYISSTYPLHILYISSTYPVSPAGIAISSQKLEVEKLEVGSWKLEVENPV